MFYKLFLIILCFELLTVIYNCFKLIIIRTKSKSNNNKVFENTIPNFQINVLIPCLREQEIIKSTLNNFLNIINKNTTNIYIITTNKEIYEKEISKSLIPSLAQDIYNHVNLSKLISKYNKLFSSSQLEKFLEYKNKTLDKLNMLVQQEYDSSLTTFEYLNTLDELNNNQNVHIINYPFDNGNMADQLNYAIKTITSDSTLTDNKIYFSIYNADSIPNEKTFLELENKIIENDFPEILQQYSIFTANFKKLSNIMKGFSIYQSAFEIRNGIINNFLSKKLYSHVVGHGLTIRFDILENLNGFNTNFWCEDIFLTALIKNTNLTIIPLSTLEIAESPEYFKILIKQNAVWFKTAFQYHKILKEIKQSYKLSLNGFIWFLHEMRATFVWLLLPIFLNFTFIFPLIIKNGFLFFISLLVFLLFVYFNYFANLFVIKKEFNIKFSIKLFFFTCISILLTNLGPIYSFFIKEKFKTAR